MINDQSSLSDIAQRLNPLAKQSVLTKNFCLPDSTRALFYFWTYRALCSFTQAYSGATPLTQSRSSLVSTYVVIRSHKAAVTSHQGTASNVIGQHATLIAGSDRLRGDALLANTMYFDFFDVIPALLFVASVNLDKEKLDIHIHTLFA